MRGAIGNWRSGAWEVEWPLGKDMGRGFWTMQKREREIEREVLVRVFPTRNQGDSSFTKRPMPPYPHPLLLAAPSWKLWPLFYFSIFLLPPSTRLSLSLSYFHICICPDKKFCQSWIASVDWGQLHGPFLSN